MKAKWISAVFGSKFCIGISLKKKLLANGGIKSKVEIGKRTCVIHRIHIVINGGISRTTKENSKIVWRRCVNHGGILQVIIN